MADGREDGVYPVALAALEEAASEAPDDASIAAATAYGDSDQFLCTEGYLISCSVFPAPARQPVPASASKTSSQPDSPDDSQAVSPAGRAVPQYPSGEYRRVAGVQGGWSNPSDFSVSIASARVRPRCRRNHSPV